MLRRVLLVVAAAMVSMPAGFTLTDGALMTMTLSISGDKMAGEWRTPDGETGAVTFERKKL